MVTSDKILWLSAHALCLLVTCHASPVFEAYRLVQYDLEGTPSGARTARLSQYGALKRDGVTLFRSVVLLPIQEATLHIVKEILKPVNGVAGLIFLLPDADAPMGMDEMELEMLMELEKFLILQAIAIPVYFVENSSEMHAIMKSIEKAIENGRPPNNIHGGYLLQVKSPGSKPLRKSPIHTFEGWLRGSDERVPGRPSSPTIVISAHYDGFSAAPGMPGSGNGSGVVALLSLVRYFSTFYKNPATRPRYNILFLLTGGAGMNFNGLRYWLKNAENRVLDSIQFALSLDTLAGPLTDDQLHFHYSRPPKDAAVAEWYGTIQEAAKFEGISLPASQKKINLALPYMSWEHELFAQQKILGATISGCKGGNPMFRSPLPEILSTNHSELLGHVISLVGNAISSKLFENGAPDLQSFHDARGKLPGLHSAFIQEWTRSLRRLPRTAPFFSVDSPFAVELLRFLKEHTDKGTITTIEGDPSYLFYDAIALELKVFETAGVLFDVLLFLSVGLYLTALFFILKYVTQGWTAVVSLFSPPKRNQRKGVPLAKTWGRN